MSKLSQMAERLERFETHGSEIATACALLREAEALLQRIRSSINVNGELSALCMQDIDDILGEPKA